MQGIGAGWRLLMMSYSAVVSSLVKRLWRIASGLVWSKVRAVGHGNVVLGPVPAT